MEWKLSDATAITYQSECRAFLIVLDIRKKGKDAVPVFVDNLIDNCCAKGAKEYVIRSDESTSEFKNKYMVKSKLQASTLMEKLCYKPREG